MSEPRRILLVGASGLVGRAVMEQAVDRSEVRLVALVRREIALPPGARMEVLVAPPEEWSQAIATIGPQAVICALGTTIRQVEGDKERFAAIDRDLVRKVANEATRARATNFALVSSVGADRHSRNFYLRTKGEAEDAVAKAGFRRLDILQPGLLRGDRGGMQRPLERLGRMASPLADLLLHGNRRIYRSVRAGEVAAAALQAAIEKAPGRAVHRHDDIIRMARRWHR